MGVQFDRSWHSVLVKCTDCPYWAALALDQREAYLSGERHNQLVHDMAPHDAEAPRRLWETRHAANT